jgi:hypothetical protein
MKRAVVIFVLAALVVISTIWWLAESGSGISTGALLQVPVILIVVGLAVFLGIRRLKSARRGEPAEDELSRKVQLKASSLSFYISIYLWLAIMYYSDKVQLETHTLIGLGIMGMAVVFALTWAILNFRGVGDE